MEESGAVQPCTHTSYDWGLSHGWNNLLQFSLPVSNPSVEGIVKQRTHGNVHSRQCTVVMLQDHISPGNTIGELWKLNCFYKGDLPLRQGLSFADSLLYVENAHGCTGSSVIISLQCLHWLEGMFDCVHRLRALHSIDLPHRGVLQ